MHFDKCLTATYCRNRQTNIWWTGQNGGSHTEQVERKQPVKGKQYNSFDWNNVPFMAQTKMWTQKGALIKK